MRILTKSTVQYIGKLLASIQVWLDYELRNSDDYQSLTTDITNIADAVGGEKLINEMNEFIWIYKKKHMQHLD